LILLHGIGMSHAAWSPVTPYLCATRRVVAFDIAGFGRTPALPHGTDPTIANLAAGLARSLDELGIEAPVDMAGNSLGGTIALEAAAHGIAKSVVAISPAGLWRAHPPRHVKHVFRALRLAATHVTNGMKMAMQVPWLREILLTVPLSAGSARMPAREARRAIDDLAGSTAFEETFEHTRAPFFRPHIKVPVTVAFGDRDGILPRRSRWREGLPAHTTWVDRPRWGHVPMWVDPTFVAELILEGIATNRVHATAAAIGRVQM
jgi:pimeloyl-ACP methyl ester carboxylesterase